EAQAQQIDQEGLESFVAHWEAQPLFSSHAQLPSAIRSRLRQERLSNNPRGLANALRGLGTGVQSSLWDRLPDLFVPTLLIAGEMDEKYRRIGQEMAAQLPQARLAVVPGAGHTVHLEQPVLFDKLVTSFLTELN
ncbi:MAG TPA: alpha/beta fold hydrolase, partial [Aggregatilineales bacterium]|nr:alpha/beta fold hydrolase [Aggregatilineales bacterium]